MREQLSCRSLSVKNVESACQRAGFPSQKGRSPSARKGPSWQKKIGHCVPLLEGGGSSVALPTLVHAATPTSERRLFSPAKEVRYGKVLSFLKGVNLRVVMKRKRFTSEKHVNLICLRRESHRLFVVRKKRQRQKRGGPFFDNQCRRPTARNGKETGERGTRPTPALLVKVRTECNLHKKGSTPGNQKLGNGRSVP